jgi:serine phosphatase RsbU (regulator of sigma subunit)
MNKSCKYVIFLMFPVFLLLTPKMGYTQLSAAKKNELAGLTARGEKYKETGKLSSAAAYYYKAGMLCFQSAAYEESTVYFEQAKDLFMQLERFKEAQSTYRNLALAHANSRNYSRALLYIENGLKLTKQFGTDTEYVGGLLDMAFIYAEQRNYKEAIRHAQKALELAAEINNPELTLICFDRLEAYYRLAGNTRKAAEYQDRFAQLDEHVQKQKTQKMEKELDVQKIIAEYKQKESELKYEMDLKLVEKEKEFAKDSLGMIVQIKQDSIEKANLRAQQDSTQIILLQQKSETQQARIAQEQAEAEAQRRIIMIISIGFGILLIAGILLILNRRKIQKQRKELAKAFAVIEEQNKDISDSIHYAREIQKAFLPNQADLSLLFKESFIFFEPRDIVSGDYFWFTKTKFVNGSGEKTDKYLAAAIDCTGHGVPGALLSMTGFNILENIVNDKKIHEPAKILDTLHEEIRKKLRQHETPNRDGMDMALISYTPKTKELQFAGAKNPLILIQDKKVKRVKGNIKPIGGEIFELTEKQTFKQHNITIEKPATLYIFSDGFADQLGGEKNRKYMKTKFRDFLFKNHEAPLKKQHDLIAEEFNRWTGNKAQIDDIIVIGIKLVP